MQTHHWQLPFNVVSISRLLLDIIFAQVFSFPNLRRIWKQHMAMLGVQTLGSPNGWDIFRYRRSCQNIYTSWDSVPANLAFCQKNWIHRIGTYPPIQDVLWKYWTVFEVLHKEEVATTCNPRRPAKTLHQVCEYKFNITSVFLDVLKIKTVIDHCAL